jgi:hypothetical protein
VRLPPLSLVAVTDVRYLADTLPGLSCPGFTGPLVVVNTIRGWFIPVHPQVGIRTGGRS